MPSFDIVSEVEMHEVTNALDQANKELDTRFDLKNTGSRCERADNLITVTSNDKFHLEQVMQVMRAKLAKRKVNLLSLSAADPVESGREVRQVVTIRQGIEADTGRKIIKAIKDSKVKVQTAMQEAKVRVTGKKRDDLQGVIALLKEADFGLPLQFSNFRD